MIEYKKLSLHDSKRPFTFGRANDKEEENCLGGGGRKKSTTWRYWWMIRTIFVSFWEFQTLIRKSKRKQNLDVFLDNRLSPLDSTSTSNWSVVAGVAEEVNSEALFSSDKYLIIECFIHERKFQFNLFPLFLLDLIKVTSSRLASSKDLTVIVLWHVFIDKYGLTAKNIKGKKREKEEEKTTVSTMMTEKKEKKRLADCSSMFLFWR